LIDIINDTVNIHLSQVPSFRIKHAIERGNLKRVLMTMFAGIGDQVCAEPTLRYAVRCRDRGEIDHLGFASSAPSLYSHLKFDEVITTQYDVNQWFIMDTIPRVQGLSYEHISHGLTNCVDASSLYAFRMQLPTEDREIRITPTRPIEVIAELFKWKTILVHAGKHWPSKTFPKKWWNDVLFEIRKRGIKPILIGSNVDGNRTTVNVDNTGCIDLRGKTDLGELAWVCQRATVLLSNDSAPIHFAASEDPGDRENTGLTWIHTLATCKHFDYISHFRKGQWQFREVNYSLGGVWDILGFLPNKESDVRVDNTDSKLVESWLPDPKEYAEAALGRL